MIEAFLEQSRRSKPPSPSIEATYNIYYRNLRSLLGNYTNFPTFKVTYSTERRCEFVCVEGADYILYDQYLGQSFNQLNRVLLAKHGQSFLARAYACKFLAERLVTLGHAPLATFFAACYVQFSANSRREGDPYEFDRQTQVFRNNLLCVQENFVLSHEMAHYLFDKHSEAPTKATLARLEKFLSESASRPSKISEEPLVQSIRRDFDLSAHYRKALDGIEVHQRELVADDFGAAFALQLANLRYGIPFSTAKLALVLAFKYTRLFRHLELLARALAPLEYSSDPIKFQTLLNSLDHNVWDQSERRIQFYQLREHFIRHRVDSSFPYWGVQTNDENEVSVSELVDQYDHYIESSVLYTLIDSIKTRLSFDILLDLRHQQSQSKSDLHP